MFNSYYAFMLLALGDAHTESMQYCAQKMKVNYRQYATEIFGIRLLCLNLKKI